jgi:DNA-directed RNA polymerase subunit RPC12/RpoP
MALTLVHPPTIFQLMEDKFFQRMMKRIPSIPDNLMRPELPPMWHIWVEKDGDKWARGRARTYHEAWDKFRQYREMPDVVDISIVNIRFMMPPPIGFKWQYRKFPWCARCRRPSLFTHTLDHRADPFSEIVLDEPIRCYYCGIRQIALPKHSPR